MIFVSPRDLQDLCQNIFQAHHVPPEESKWVVDSLIYANLCGHDSHGVFRLREYVAKLKNGTICPGKSLQIIQELGAVGVADGQHGFGAVLGTQAMEWTMARAEQFGIGLLVVRNANYLGMISYYASKALARNMVGIVACNASPHVVPWGGRAKRIGTNPVSIAIPSVPPLVLDMSTTAVARAKIMLAHAKGEEIPEGWAIDPEGNPTTSPEAALKGGVLPLGAKGYGLALAIDLLAGALSGSGCGPEVKGLDFPEDFSNAGELFMSVNVDAFLPHEKFASRTEEVLQKIKSSPATAGFAEVLIPGERARRESQKRLENGIPLDHNTVDLLRGLASEVGIDPSLISITLQCPGHQRSNWVEEVGDLKVKEV